MLVAAAIASLLIIALYVHQHVQIAVSTRTYRRARLTAPVAKPVRVPATLHMRGPSSRVDWTKLEAYDPLPLDDLDWLAPRVVRDGRPSAR